MPAPVPGDRSLALQPPQPRRGRDPRGVDQRPALFRAAHTRSATASSTTRPAVAGRPASPGPRRCGRATTRPSSAATSSSPRSGRSCCRSRASTRRASLSLDASPTPGRRRRPKGADADERRRRSPAAPPTNAARPAAEEKVEEDPASARCERSGRPSIRCGNARAKVSDRGSWLSVQDQSVASPVRLEPVLPSTGFFFLFRSPARLHRPRRSRAGILRRQVRATSPAKTG